MSNKPRFEKLVEEPGQSFLFRKIIRKNRPSHRSDGVWHYHPDYEITLTFKSSGQRFVGYRVEDYSPFDLVLLGENLPHCWITNQYTEQYVINFKRNLFESIWQNNPEFTGIRKLLDKSKQGIKFSASTIEQATPIIMKISEMDGLNRLLEFFKLLDIFASSENTQFLTFNDYEIGVSLKSFNRIEQIYSYINNNYNNENVSVSNLSNELHMTTSSLCKFIKVLTKKTFTELLFETRISKACKLLSETDKYVSEICFCSGFNNLSGFNRAFKKLMHVSPKEYRKLYREVN